MNKTINVSDSLGKRIKAISKKTGLKQQAIIIRGIEIAVDILEKENGFMTTGKFNPAEIAEKKIKFQNENNN